MAGLFPGARLGNPASKARHDQFRGQKELEDGKYLGRRIVVSLSEHALQSERHHDALVTDGIGVLDNPIVELSCVIVGKRVAQRSDVIRIERVFDQQTPVFQE